MIEVIISSTFCANCERQQAIMQNSFFNNEYRIIRQGSPAFESLDLKDQIDELPCVIVRDDAGIRLMAKGVMDGTSLRQAQKSAPKPTSFWKNGKQASLAS